MNRGMQDDFKRDGLMSQLMKRISDLEAFEREFRVKQIGSGGSGGMAFLYDQTLGASAGIINIYPTSTIPTTGKDIHVRIIARTDRAALADGINLEVNDDAVGANYSTYVMWHHFDSLWDDQTPASNRIFAYANGATATANHFAAYDLIIYDYLATDKYKEFQSRGGQRIGTGAGDHYIYDAKGSWLSLNAITKVELTPVFGPNFITGTRVTAWLEG